MKKIISLLLSITMLVGSIACVDFSAYAESYKCGDNISYHIDSGDKTLYITGYGDMYDWGTQENPYPPYWSNQVYFNNVVISEGITSIGTYAFFSCDGIFDISFPNSIRKIGDKSFYHCYNLKINSLPSDLQEIGYGAFLYCYGIEDLVLPNKLKEVTAAAFSGCKNLSNITIPYGVTSIGDSAFEGCESLSNITIPDSVTSIGNSAFRELYNCTGGLENITISNNVTNIGDYAFFNCKKITELDLPNDLKCIGESAFAGCENLENIIIPNGVESIGDSAFNGCISLEKIVLSKCNISMDEFYGCVNLSNIVIPEGVNSIGSSAFYGCTSLEYITIPNSVTSIGGDAFEKCENLTTIEFGKDLDEFPYWAFYRCTKLRNIIIDNNNENYYSDGSIVFSKDKTILIFYSEGNKQDSYSVPNGIEEIERMAFAYCESLQNIVLPNSINQVESSAFSFCKNLKSITIPKSIRFYGRMGYALNGTSVTDIYYSSIMDDWNNISSWFSTDVITNAKIHCTDGTINDSTEVHNSFTSAGKTFSGAYGYYYKDSYFNNFANEYNQSLATMSLCLAFSTYNASSDYETADKNVKSILDQCGFKDYEQTMYHEKPDSGTIAFSIANKELENDENLVVVAVRSGGYEAEWASNMTVGNTGNHEGFQNSADCVYRVLENYITNVNHNLTGKKVKFWITGFSRGAAVSNLLAAKLFTDKFNEVNYTPINDVYAYCFATPAGAIETNDPHNECFNNIFNIIEYNDPVPLLAPCQWNFSRYGREKVFPYAESTNDAFNYSNPMISRLKAMGYEYKASNFKSKEIGNYFFSNRDSLGTFYRKRLCDSKIGSFVPSVVGSRKNYVNAYQPGARNTVTSGFDLLDYILGIPPALTYASLHSTTIKTFVDNRDLLYDVHANQAIYLAWMQSMDSNYVAGAKPCFSNGDYRVAKVNCPVDVYVYDNDNKLVASIINEVPQDLEGSSIISSIDENGQKIVYLPCDADYRVEVTARENCETTYTINEFVGVNSEISRVINYSEVNMKKDETLVSNVDSYSEQEIENGAESGTKLSYTTELSSIEINPYLDVSGEEIANYTYIVDVQFNDEEGTITGGGAYTAGDFCQVTATNNVGYEFEGWYIDDAKISLDYTYRFAVKDNVTIEAKYIICKHSEYSTEIIAPTCTEDGYTLHSCSICGYSYKDDYIMSTGTHNYVNGFCTQCNEQDPKYKYPIFKENSTTIVNIENGGDYSYFYFFPESDGDYVIESTGEYDTYGYLYDEDMNEISHNDDDGESSNFLINEYLEKGKVYIIGAKLYNSEETGTFSISIIKQHQHNYSNGICIDCGAKDPLYEIPTITENQNVTVNIENAGDICYFYFNPKDNGTYNIYSSGAYDTYGYLYDKDMNEISSSDDGDYDENFMISEYLEKDKTYIIGCRMYSSSITGMFKISVEKQHTHSYFSKVVLPTCTDKGYTTYTCTCGDNYSSNYVDAKGHIYDSGKVTKEATCTSTGVKTYTCTVCGDTKTETIAKTAHTYKTTTTKATTSKNGSKVTKCSVCGTVKSKSTIYYPKTITLSTTSYTYNGSIKKPTVKVVGSNGKAISSSNYTVTYASGRKNVGKYSVKITFKGNYSGTKTLYFTINPKGTSISSVTAKSKGFTVKWKKQATQTTGYEIQYATDSKFTKNKKTVIVSKNSTTSKTISKLSAKKKYYVRIRTYKTVKVNGKSTNIYSNWSKAKYVTTKK
ncbi:MAG: leucine-rich repeat protein [Eubacterium sp.]